MKIYETINNVMSELGAIPKNRMNQQQKFSYRGVEDVMNTLQPLLTKYKLFATPEVLEHKREERKTNSGGTLLYSICRIKYTFYAEDGSNVTVTVMGEGMDSGDKASNKAMSVAFKYACFQIFCIPTEEMKDPDAETPEPSKAKLSEKQINELIEIAKNNGFDENQVKAFAAKAFKKEDVSELTVKEYGIMITRLKATKSKQMEASA